jgi:SSS family solute:Na+ symporter
MYAMGALPRAAARVEHPCVHRDVGGVVLLYIALGGLTSAIYNEVLQFFLIVFGFTPVAYLGLRDAGGWSGLCGARAETFVHSWTYLGRPTAIRWASSGSAW